MEPNSGLMLAIVARSASGNAATPGPKNSTNMPTTPCARSRSVSVSTRSVAVAPSGSAPRSAHAGDARKQHRDRLPEHHRLGLDPADAPAEHAEPVDHRRVRVGADDGVGIQQPFALEHDAREELEVDLMDDPGVRRHDLEAVERLLAPAQERVALGVALELPLGVEPERVARPEAVDLHRMVDHELDRDLRIDAAGVAPELGDRVAQAGEVDHRGHAGQVLQQDTGGREGDLAVIPVEDRLDIGVGPGAERVLEQELERERQPRRVEVGERDECMRPEGRPSGI